MEHRATHRLIASTEIQIIDRYNSFSAIEVGCKVVAR